MDRNEILAKHICFKFQGISRFAKKKVCRGFCNDLWQVCGYYMLIWLICIFSWFLLQIRVWELWKCKNADATTHISEWLRRPRRLRVCQWFTDQIISGIFPVLCGTFQVEMLGWTERSNPHLRWSGGRGCEKLEGHWRPLKATEGLKHQDRNRSKEHEGRIFFF